MGKGLIGLRGRGKRSCMNTRAFFSSFPLSWAHRGGNGRGAGGYEKSYFSRRSVLCKICGYNFWVWALDNLFLWVRAWVGGIYGVPQSALGVCRIPLFFLPPGRGRSLGGGGGGNGGFSACLWQDARGPFISRPSPQSMGWAVVPKSECKMSRHKSEHTAGWIARERTHRGHWEEGGSPKQGEKREGRRAAEAVVGAGSRSV